jgi:hypothetical protein
MRSSPTGSFLLFTHARGWRVAILGASEGALDVYRAHACTRCIIATGLVTVALLAKRSDFDAPGDPEVHPRLAARALLFGGVIFGYAFIAL